MIENFLRPPRTAAEWAADVLRVGGALSVIIAAVFFQLTDAGIVALALPGLVAGRFMGLRPSADMTLSLTLLIAAWSNVFDLYTRISWWDLVVHLVCTGVIAAGTYLLMADTRLVLPPRDPRLRLAAPVVLTTTIGLAISAVWEMIEWFGREYISDQIFIAYADTIGDMAMGGLGSLCAGFVVAVVSLQRPPAVPQLP